MTVPEKVAQKGAPSLQARLAAHRQAHLAAPQSWHQQPDQHAAEEEEEELEHRVVWSSAPKYRPSQAPQGAEQLGGTAASLKDQGNAALKKGDCEAAFQSYTAAIKACEGEGGGAQAAAVLYSNRAHSLIRLQRYQLAVMDAEAAVKLAPGWPKPHYRLAQAHAALQAWHAAWVAARAGEALVDDKTRAAVTDFTPLMDRIAVEAGLQGNMVGFDGRRLEVRHAGDDAWLCRPAPEDPLLDFVDKDEPTSLLPLGITNSSGGGASPAALGRPGGTALAKTRVRTSFRSTREAVEAAKDGDQILLCKGIHNGSGNAVDINKRIVIRGEGSLGEAVYDQRANSPAFRITRNCLLHNIDIDFTGFKEAIHIAGPATLQPLIQCCIIKDTGDDAINIADHANPIIRGCQISGKKCGVRVFGSAGGLIQDCGISKMGEAGVKVMENGHPSLQRVDITECGEEGVLAMDAGRVYMHDCTSSGCSGPGIDVSGQGRVEVVGGSIKQNVGGIFMWEDATASLVGVHLEGGTSHVILADADSQPKLQDCYIRGNVHATDLAWTGIWDESNKLVDPEEPTDLPPEEGPFKFVPDPYRRKQ